MGKYPYALEMVNDKDWNSQYDDHSAAINFAMVRHFKPTVIVEFGARNGRCTHDILLALKENKKKFVFKPFELDPGFQNKAQDNIWRAFGKDFAPLIGGDIMKADNIPHGIDYLFIDNHHDEEITRWVFNTLLPDYCADKCLVHFHDLSFVGDFEPQGNFTGETAVIEELHKSNKLPLTKVYWTWEEGLGRSSSWWRYHSRRYTRKV